MAAGLQQKEFTSKALTEAYLLSTKTENKRLGAYLSLWEEEAMRQAERADRRIAEGTATPLTGIPLAIKDNICTKGAKTTCGSKMLADFVPPYDATVIARLKAQNAVLLGKTNMDEFAMGSTSTTSYFGAVKNPYDINRVAGGSSGGSAVAVAAGLCAAALGSDTGGSIRQPAAFCGITGLKPTYGTVSRYGLIAFASSMDQIGPLARTSEDCALLLNAIAGADPKDATCQSGARPDYTEKIGRLKKGMKIGLPIEWMETDMSSVVRCAVETTAKRLRDLGFVVESVSLPHLKYAISSYYLLSSAEAASNLSRYDGVVYGHRHRGKESYEQWVKQTRREGFGDEVKRRIMLGNYALSAGYYNAYYQKAVALREILKEECKTLLSSYDLLLSPTAPGVAFLQEKEQTPAEMYAADICTVVANLTGLPALSFPVFMGAKELPVGVQLMGRPFGEATLLAVADELQKSLSEGGVL